MQTENYRIYSAGCVNRGKIALSPDEYEKIRAAAISRANAETERNNAACRRATEYSIYGGDRP